MTKGNKIICEGMRMTNSGGHENKIFCCWKRVKDGLPGFHPLAAATDKMASPLSTLFSNHTLIYFLLASEADMIDAGALC